MDSGEHRAPVIEEVPPGSVEEREALRTDLAAIGFDVVRFVAVAPPPSHRFDDWLREGGHADMAWLERTAEKRNDLEQVLPGARTVIVLGVNYWPDDSQAAGQELWAKYALYEDYHDSIREALAQAGRLLEERFGVGPLDYRYYADTGPVLERGWAAASGAGFQGKNGMLISREFGNWLFLAVIATRISFAPDEPLRGWDGQEEKPGLFCGTCTRCIEACPTGAIVKPGLVDSRLCISYQTIENKGAIPRELRAGIGRRLYGCDICLDVCPWNRFAHAGRMELLARRYDLAGMKLSEILNLTVEQFREVFRRTPIKRIKWERLLRNACVVAGNLGDTDPGDAEAAERSACIEAVARLCAHSSPLVRTHAVWALFRLEGPAARERLGEARRAETDEAVLAEYAFWEAAPAGTRG